MKVLPKRIFVGIVTLVVAGVSASLSVRADAQDISISETVEITSAQLHQMTDPQSPRYNQGQAGYLAHFGLGQPMTSVLSNHKSQIRRDMRQQSVLILPASSGNAITATLLNHKSHTFASLPYQRDKDIAEIGTITSNVHALGDTKVILGHLCRHYQMTLDAPQQTTHYEGDIWAAPDIKSPTIPITLDNRPLSLVESQLSKIPGLPLQVTMRGEGGIYGDMSVEITVDAVSSTPLSEAIFMIPKTYQAALSGAPAQ